MLIYVLLVMDQDLQLLPHVLPHQVIVPFALLDINYQEVCVSHAQIMLLHVLLDLFHLHVIQDIS